MEKVYDLGNCDVKNDNKFNSFFILLIFRYLIKMHYLKTAYETANFP